MYHVYQATEVSGLRKIPLSNILYKNFISNELNIKAKSLNKTLGSLPIGQTGTGLPGYNLYSAYLNCMPT